MVNAADRKNTEPAHGNVNGGVEPFWGINPDSGEEQTCQSQSPDDQAEGCADRGWQNQHADRCIASGDQKIDHNMIQLF